MAVGGVVCAARGSGDFAERLRVSAGCANFYLRATRAEDAKVIADIAQSFRPKPPKGQANKTDFAGEG